ncbi:MAG: PqqD family peptide modification chaperone [Burkholderiales bacterium]
MADDLLSPSWYRVAQLQPRLRSHARIHRHEYRGERWYVLEDRISRRSHRFNPVAYYVIGLMNGHRTLQEIWDAAVARFGDDAPKQDDVIRLVGQLHLADVLQCEISPDVDELLRRSYRLAGRQRLAKFLSPLAIKFPLLDPDRLLERWLPLYRPFFGTIGFLVWLGVLGTALFLMVQNWSALTEDITDRVLAPENLVVMLLVFPVLKAFHEFGHACAVKAWGGEVHEMGIMLLVLMPIPYVDASSANAFPEKSRRLLVGAAGMVIEVFIASIALFFWLEMEPGLLRAILFNVMVIAGISTVLFNANPLLRFDGYYILSDLIEMPNLRARSNQYLASVFQRTVFGVSLPESDAPLRERLWMVFFAIAAFIYRLFITFAIAVFVAGKYFIIGILLAIFALMMSVVMPLVMAIFHIALHPRLRRHRFRAATTSGLLAGLVVFVLFGMPVPSWTNAEGVIWLPEQSLVRAGASGFATRLLVEPGAQVEPGQPLIETVDPQLPLEIRVLEAQKAELEARYQSERVENIVRSQITLEQLKAIQADLERSRERAEELTIRSPMAGVFLIDTPQDLPGRYIRKGERIAYVVAPATATARVLVPQEAIDLVRSRTEAVRVKLAERLDDAVPARIRREVPGASQRLPSLALAQSGGGRVALDPREGGKEPQALQAHFEFELEIPLVRPAGFGGRVYVRFEHGDETIADQIYRGVRQLFLERFVV